MTEGITNQAIDTTRPTGRAGWTIELFLTPALVLSNGFGGEVGGKSTPGYYAGDLMIPRKGLPTKLSAPRARCLDDVIRALCQAENGKGRMGPVRN